MSENMVLNLHWDEDEMCWLIIYNVLFKVQKFIVASCTCLFTLVRNLWCLHLVLLFTWPSFSCDLWSIKDSSVNLYTCVSASLKPRYLGHILVVHNLNAKHIFCNWERTPRGTPGHIKSFNDLLCFLFPSTLTFIKSLCMKCSKSFQFYDPM